MIFVVGAIETFTCGHQYWSSIVRKEREDTDGTSKEGQCIAGPDTTWIKHISECNECKINDLDHDQVTISPPPSPLLDPPDNLNDSRGGVTEYRCGHRRFFTRDEGGLPVLGMDKLGFLLAKSRDDCPRCEHEKFKDEFRDDFKGETTSTLSQALTFPTVTSRMTRPSQRQDEESPPMRMSQLRPQRGMAIGRSFDARLDPDEGINLESARHRGYQQAVDEMMLSSTFDLSPESNRQKRKQSKTEKIKAIGKSIWGSIKRNI
ncbi:60899943-3545-4944-865d-48320c509bd0 [Sclerotinia trifoliorum]|uniref:60899943-3545-4944-865d-48320c509bd0 n=1 Tax=Sclerotinia trifoliorum TaxID=28548 RepID=A0A8H2W5N0_9HELO|nr:60899943-3545-4944-865d-48320c509bd0 [Sclerotinia trifoliorum]